MFITQFLGWTYGVIFITLVVLSCVLGYHISEDTHETKEYAQTGRMRVRTGITTILAIASIAAIMVGGSIDQGTRLTENDTNYWLNLIPWFVFSVIAFGWWIAHLNHLYKVVRLEEAGILTAVDSAIKVRFPLTPEKLKQLQAIVE